jgi:peptidyl-prolyl cis-trans isomerase-like 4
VWATLPQFYITTREDIDYLDEKHTIFGEVAEGLDVLSLINETFVDERFRPLQDIRCASRHVHGRGVGGATRAL